MKKLALLGFSFLLLFLLLLSPTNVFAAGKVGANGECKIPPANVDQECIDGFTCQLKAGSLDTGTCIKGSTITITKPTQGFTSLGNAISNILTVAFAVAILVVLVMLIWGAFEWITSGGDKETVGKARGRIINALIGLAVLAIAYALTRVAGTFLGFNLLEGLPIPTPPK